MTIVRSARLARILPIMAGGSAARSSSAAMPSSTRSGARWIAPPAGRDRPPARCRRGRRRQDAVHERGRAPRRRPRVSRAARRLRQRRWVEPAVRAVRRGPARPGGRARPATIQPPSPDPRRPTSPASCRASGPRADSITSEWVQSRLFEAVLGLSTRLAERSPTLLIVEDLHWADAATRETIAFLVRTLRDVPFLFVGTFRSDELHRRHPLLPWLAELDRGGRVERLTLARLDRTQLARCSWRSSGAQPAPDLVDDVFGRSDGNPFFAEELLAASRQGRAPGPARCRRRSARSCWPTSRPCPRPRPTVLRVAGGRRPAGRARTARPGGGPARRRPAGGPAGRGRRTPARRRVRRVTWIDMRSGTPSSRRSSTTNCCPASGAPASGVRGGARRRSLTPGRRRGPLGRARPPLGAAARRTSGRSTPRCGPARAAIDRPSRSMPRCTTTSVRSSCGTASTTPQRRDRHGPRRAPAPGRPGRLPRRPTIAARSPIASEADLSRDPAVDPLRAGILREELGRALCLGDPVGVARGHTARASR